MAQDSPPHAYAHHDLMTPLMAQDSPPRMAFLQCIRYDAAAKDDDMGGVIVLPCMIG